MITENPGSYGSQDLWILDTLREKYLSNTAALNLWHANLAMQGTPHKEVQKKRNYMRSQDHKITSSQVKSPESLSNINLPQILL